MGLTPEEFLEHYGVKGQKWGVVKKEESGRDSGGGVSLGALGKGKPETDEDRSAQLKAKYGPDSMKDIPPVPPQKQRGWNSLSDTQKKLIIGAGGVAVAGGLLYLYGKDSQARQLARDQRYVDESVGKIKKFKDLADMSPDKINVGLNAHWDKGVDLKPGHILQRLSTVKETDVRPSGFFAAFDPKDVERYKGELPIWWKKWGGDFAKANDGYLTQIAAQKGVKAPSGKETLDILKSVYDDDRLISQLVGGPGLLAMKPNDRAKVVEGMAKSGFNNFVVHFANGMDHDPHVQKFFGLVKDRGYNAVIDFNDSGKLARTPIRLLDGIDFKVVGNVRVPRIELDKAAVNLKELVMAALDRLGSFLEHHGFQSRVDSFLEHVGVKGMRWGVRRNGSSVTSGKKQKPVSTDRKRVDKLRSKGAPALSTKQLKSVKERMELESSFSRLNPTKVQKGHAHVKEFLAIAGTAGSLYALSKSPAGKALMNLGKTTVKKQVSEGALSSAVSAVKTLPPDAFIG